MKSFTKEELEALFSAAEKHSAQDALMLRTIFNHGLRVSEVLGLTSKNLEARHLVVKRLKGSRKTTQPLLMDEREGLEALAKTSGARPLFPICRMTAWRKLQQYGKEAGIPAFKLHPHALKHSTGRLGYEAGMGIPELQKYLGHASGASTMIYLEAGEEESCASFAAAKERTFSNG